MKKILLVVAVAAIFIIVVRPKHIAQDTATSTTPSAEHHTPRYERITYGGHAFHVVRVDLRNDDLRMFYKNAKGQRYGSIGALKDALAQRGETLAFATNGGIYAEDFSPLGLYIEDDEQIGKLNTSKASTGNFFVQPNGVFEIFPDTHAIYTTDEWKGFKRPRPEYAVQSGPMLLIDGVINSKFTANSENRLLRSGVGSISTSEVAFVLSDDVVNFYEFAAFFRDRLGADRALYLDGTISDLYIDGRYLGPIQTEYSTLIGVVTHDKRN